MVLVRDAWNLGGSNVFLLVLILLSTSRVLLRSTYQLPKYIVLLDIITLSHQMFLYIIKARLTAQVLPLGALSSFSPSLQSAN